MFGFYSSMLILIPGLIIAAIAQARVSKAYNTYSRVPTHTGLTGAQAARRLLDDNGLSHIRIERVSGKMTDHYDPRLQVMRLSNDVADKASIASVGIAAHETGHAIQHAQGYVPLKFRNAIVPVCSFTSNAAWPLFFIGLVLGGNRSSFGLILMDVGILLFCLALVFYIVTLPVEFNASHRAVLALEEYHIVEAGEISGVKKVLGAAAMTYVASTLMAFLNLFRMLAIRGRN
ncbi:MAG: zinc metallopeptidase [Eubacterium aggregans]|uniref:Neutral zinc metallopeptidase n=1 Tax=Eubacterium aggregans TaxID=81409 RepID=A0A1H3XG50_9FIRM|nr:zinc metallopeptidase [Eubacterium aggregans]MDD4690740.1 zinc metallopeptidase [Eubacterium aggregans]MEA5073220.1 zinc metallopeptidase [Eubacterium aggregans]SDZ98326.1 hypothetical protein SAMN04515656_10247 [Eubacterium aggregans]